MTDKPETYRTKTGRVLTDADIQALADEAERGYDVEHLAKRPGRPRMGSAPAMVVPVRLHADLLAALKATAAAESTSLSELVRDALRAYLGGEPPAVADLRTASGRVLTDAEIDALATEAEAGYDIGALRGRASRRGRPWAEVVPVRMPPELKAEVERRAEAESTSVSEIVREALRARLGGDDNPPGGGARHAGRHGPTEAETCRDYVVPRLKEAGWEDSQAEDEDFVGSNSDPKLIHHAARGGGGAFGDEFPDVTYQPGAGRGRLWRCPICRRVELVLLNNPRCSGAPENLHAVADAEPVSEDEGFTPSDNRNLFAYRHP